MTRVNWSGRWVDPTDLSFGLLTLYTICIELNTVIYLNWRLCFWGAPHIFQIKYSRNMSGTVKLLEIWEMTTTLLMSPWPVRMISGWKLTRWSWLGRSSLLNYLTVIVTSTILTSWFVLSRGQAAAPGEPMLSCQLSPNSGTGLSITRGRWWSCQPSLG